MEQPILQTTTGTTTAAAAGKKIPPALWFAATVAVVVGLCSVGFTYGAMAVKTGGLGRYPTFPYHPVLMSVAVFLVGLGSLRIRELFFAYRAYCITGNSFALLARFVGPGKFSSRKYPPLREANTFE